MKSKDVIRMGSFRALAALLDETETSALPGIARARAAFITEIEKAEALEKLQAEDIRLTLQLRDAAFQNLETVVLRVGAQASSYAHETGDPQLILRCRLPLRELTGGSFGRRLSAAERVHDQIVELLPVLEEGDITAAEVAELTEAIADARARQVEPRQQLGRRMNATAELNRQVRRLAEFVRERLDTLFRPVRRENPGLYLRYRVARKQLHRSSSRKSEKTEMSTGSMSMPATAAVTGTTATVAAGSPTPTSAELRLAA